MWDNNRNNPLPATWRCHAILGAMLAAVVIHAAEDEPLPAAAAALIALRSSVLTAEERSDAPRMLTTALQQRLQTAAEETVAAVEHLANAAEWRSLRDGRLAALRRAIGSCQLEPMGPADVERVGTIPGDGFAIERLVIAGRAGLPITANLYVPARPPVSMPGILVVCSHHNDKTQKELQDLGMSWARAGCAVLVSDNLGYGERQQQPYGGRENYRWRYHLSMQLQTTGEAILGWMVADLRRGLDTLAGWPGIDNSRLVVIGSVAGGGDLAAVLAATDQRVACAVPYNYGRLAFPGDFDLTRCPVGSARDGVPGWLIAVAQAPRPLVLANEFANPIAGNRDYALASRIYALVGAEGNLAHCQGFGRGDQPAPLASHCNNVGPHQRAGLHPLLGRLLGLPLPTAYSASLPAEQLRSLDLAARERWDVQPVHRLLAAEAGRRLGQANATLQSLPIQERGPWLRRWWSDRLGMAEPPAVPPLLRRESVPAGGFRAVRLLLGADDGMRIPALLLLPPTGGVRAPVVLTVAQGGKDLFLARRAREIAALLDRGVAVCLVDVRGTGETVAAGDRYWYSPAVLDASRALLLGQPLLGARVRDLRTVLRYLRTCDEVDAGRLAVWGEAFAPTNPPQLVDPPMKTDSSALQAEPMGATAALLLALYEPDVRVVLARGGLIGFASLLDGPAAHVVLDAVVPGAVDGGDLAAIAAALAPRPLRLEAVVDGRNRLAAQERLERDLGTLREAYRSTADALRLSPAESVDIVDWLASNLLR